MRKTTVTREFGPDGKIVRETTVTEGGTVVPPEFQPCYPLVFPHGPTVWPHGRRLEVTC